MPPNIQIICGPARSGKTTRLLGRYRDVLAHGPPGAGLWLAPTGRSAATVRRSLLCPGFAGVLHPGVTTFGQLAEAVLRATPASEHPIDELAKKRLLAEVVDEARTTGELNYFGRVADKPGFIELLAEFISEMKRLEIWPDQLRRALNAQNATTKKDRDLQRLYELYQQRLAEGRLYDAEGRFWSARNRLHDAGDRIFSQLRILVVDGFTDFTRTQYETIELVSQRCREVYISLPLDTADERHELFAKCRKTLEQLRGRFPTAQCSNLPPPAAQAAPWPAMHCLERQLFRRPTGDQTGDQAPAAGNTPPEGVELIAATREVGEIEAIARRIKQLLTDGDAQTSSEHPVAPDDIAVVFRQLRPVADLVREVFGRFGIPFWIESGTPLSRHPLFKTLLTLLDLHAEDWPFQRLLAVVTNNMLCPQWQEAQGRGVWVETEKWIRWLKIESGRQRLLDTLRRKAQQHQADGDSTSPSESATSTAGVEEGGGEEPEETADDRPWRLAAAQSAERAHKLLLRLAEALGRLPRRATPAEWVVALEQLADELGLFAPAAPPADDTPDDAATVWQIAAAGLWSEQRVSRWLRRRPPNLDLAALRRHLLDVLAERQIPTSHDDVGRVRVLSAISARTLSVPYLFVGRLSEKEFPQPRRRSLYSEPEYQRLADAKLPVVLRAEHSQQEMLLFYEVLTRAEKRLVLSYPALDDKLQTLLPSPYLTAACQAWNIELPREAVEIDPVPRQLSPRHPGEQRLIAVDQALSGDVLRLAALIGRPRSEKMARNIVSAMRAIASRADRDRFGPFEGVFHSAHATNYLSRQFGDERHWSPSELETYALCPFRFLLERVLHVEPLDDVRLETDYIMRGNMLHKGLARYHRRQHADGAAAAQDAALGNDGDFIREFEQVMQGIVQELATFDSPRDALIEAEGRALARLARVYHDQYRRYEEAIREASGNEPVVFTPTHFEVSFGHTSQHAADDDDETTLRCEEPLELDCGDVRVRIAGRIDRIDVANVNGTTLLNVVDYKSGRAPKLAKPLDGRTLQMHLYAMAAMQCLFPEEKAIVCQAGYWALGATHQTNSPLKPCLEVHTLNDGVPTPTDEWQADRQAVLELIGRMVRHIRAGRFPVFSTDEKCTEHCPYKTVCRIQHVRALDKTWPPDAENAQRASTSK